MGCLHGGAVWKAYSQRILRLKLVQMWRVDQEEMSCAFRVYHGCFMWLKKWWGSTVFKHFLLFKFAAPAHHSLLA
jgi:hypothetical protein